MFFDKQEIFKKALKLYSSGKIFIDFIENLKLFPYIIKLQKIKQSDIQKHFSNILYGVATLQKSNLNLIYKEFKFKSIGVQRLPIGVEFKRVYELLDFIEKRDEFNQFVKNYHKVVTKYPSLKSLITKKPFLVVEYASIWDELLSVCDFFVEHPKSNLYIRELSIERVDTKFIEKHKKVIDTLLSAILDKGLFDERITSLSNYGFERKYFLKYELPQVRFRVLDEALYIAGLSDLSVTINEFKGLNLACKNIFIVENKATVLSFPMMKESIVIFGSGYKVGYLRDVKWFKGKNLYYWGDIDRDGFAILSQIRGYFKEIKSIMMDFRTAKLFEDMATNDNNSKKVLDNLTKDEAKLYEWLQSNSFRLEQERIAFGYVKSQLNARVN
jgi:hypothetical protein